MGATTVDPVLMGEDRACVGQCVDASRAARPQLAPCDQVRMVGARPWGGHGRPDYRTMPAARTAWTGSSTCPPCL